MISDEVQPQDGKKPGETSGYLQVIDDSDRGPDAVLGGRTFDSKFNRPPMFSPAEDDKLIIGIVGTFSAGKTTLARSLALRLKAGGYQTEVVAEYAREFKVRYGPIRSPYEQLVILNEQIRREQETCCGTKHDIIILETPSFVGEIYARRLINKDREFDANRAELLLSQMRDRVINEGIGCDLLFYARPNWPLFKDGVRDDHVDDRGIMDKMVGAYLVMHDIPHIEIESHDLKERIDLAMTHIAKAIRERECGPAKPPTIADQMLEEHGRLQNEGTMRIDVKEFMKQQVPKK